MHTQWRTTSSALAFLAVMLVFSPAAPAQEYDIRLSKDDKVGDQYRLVTTARHAEKTTAFIGNTAIRNQMDEFTIELVSSVQVLENNDKRRATKIALGIGKCLITRGGETKPLIDSGRTVIVVRDSPRPVFKIDNVPIEPMTQKALGLAFPFENTDLTDDDIFGTREKKSVGDSWDINTDLIAKSLKELLNVSIDKADVKGKAALEGVVKSGDEESLVISVWLNVDSFSLPLPDGVKIQDGQVKGSFSRKFPVKAARQRIEQSAKLAAWFTAVGPPDPKFQGLTIQGTIERSISSQIEPRE